MASAPLHVANAATRAANTTSRLRDFFSGSKSSSTWKLSIRFSRAHSLAAVSLTCMRPRSPAAPNFFGSNLLSRQTNCLHQHRIDPMFRRDAANQAVVLVKTRRADPFVKCVSRIARSIREIGQRRCSRQQQANDELEKKPRHVVASTWPIPATVKVG